MGTVGIDVLAWGVAHSWGTVIIELPEGFPHAGDLDGTLGVVGLFGTEVVGTKVRGLGGGAGCFPLDTGGVGTWLGSGDGSLWRF